MELKSIIKTCVTVALLSTSISVFALNEQIKCPSVEFIKSQFTDALNQVTKIESNRFDVAYDDLKFDTDSQRHWSIDVFVNTTTEADFTEAYKAAKNTIASIARPQKAYLDAHENFCGYMDKNGNATGVELYLYETNELAMKKMQAKK